MRTSNQALTLEQRQFAEDNHDVVYKFLSFRRLSKDEYYDAIIFGYLRAVKKYFERPELQQYKFSTIAFASMRTDLYNHYRKRYAQKRYAIVVSLDSLVADKDNSVNIVCNDDTAMDNIAYEQLVQAISAVLSKEQFNILQMKADGYNEWEIARHYKVPKHSIQEALSTIREILTPSLV